MDQIAVTILSSVIAAVISGLFIFGVKSWSAKADQSTQKDIKRLEEKIDANDEIVSERLKNVGDRLQDLKVRVEESTKELHKNSSSLTVLQERQSMTLEKISDLQKATNDLKSSFGKVIVK